MKNYKTYVFFMITAMLLPACYGRIKNGNDSTAVAVKKDHKTSSAAAKKGKFLEYRDSFDQTPLRSQFWSRADRAFRVEDGRLIAGNDDSPAHAVILTARAFNNFVMTWTMVRLADCGDVNDERAIILVGVGDNGYYTAENSFWLRPDDFQVGEAYEMRLVVVEGTATLYRRRPGAAEYETLFLRRKAPPEGRVGFNHDKRYKYAYDDVCIIPFSGAQPPAPDKTDAFVLSNGVVRLTWQMPEALRGVFRYRVYRSPLPPRMKKQTIIGETDAQVFEDASAPPKSTLFYHVAALNAAGQEGVAGASVIVSTGKSGAPGQVKDVFACPRRKGGVTIRWEALAGEPAKEYQILRRRAATNETERIAVKPHAPGVVHLVDAEGDGACEYGVAVVNAEGNAGPFLWVQTREPKPLEFAGLELNKLLGVGSDEEWAPPEPRKVDPNRAALRPHPRLVYTQEQIDAAKEKIETFQWARSCLENVLRMARDSMDAPAHNGNAFYLAAAYALTGEEEYVMRLRETLLYWADKYRNLPLQNGEGRARAYMLSEAPWLSDLVQAYDLAWNSPVFSDEDKRHIEEDLLRPAADLLMRTPRGQKALDHTAYNMQQMVLSAVGLAGFCLNEPKYINWAISGPYGFFKQVNHYNDDGFWWEKTISYHVTTGTPALYTLAEAAWNNNIDLWHTPVPDTCLEDLGELYPVDGDNGTKTLQQPFDALLYFMFPDHRAATFGDSVANVWVGGGFYYLAWMRYGEERYAWFNKSASGGEWGSWPKLIWWDGNDHADAQFRIGTGRFANTGVAENGSTLFPSTGYAVLRQDEANPDAPALAFTYGPMGGGHNHGDRLAYILYARKTMPIYRTSTYHQFSQAGYDEYRRTSISYNTVVVDETSHRTGNNSRNPNTGHLDFFHGGPFLQAVGAHADVCYAGVFLRRALLLGPDCLVDIFICRSPNEHVYDYVLHVDSEWNDSGLPAAPEGTRLGNGNGYQDVEVTAKGTYPGEYAAVWPFPRPFENPAGTANLGFRLMGVPGTTIFACLSPGCMKHEPLRSMFVARRKARTTVFVSVTEIFDEQPAIAVIEQLAASNAEAKEGACAGLRIHRGAYTDTVLYCETDEPQCFEDFEFCGRAAWIRHEDDSITEISLIQARSLRYGDVNLEYPAPVNARLIP